MYYFVLSDQTSSSSKSTQTVWCVGGLQFTCKSFAEFKNVWSCLFLHRFRSPHQSPTPTRPMGSQLLAILMRHLSRDSSCGCYALPPSLGVMNGLHLLTNVSLNEDVDLLTSPNVVFHSITSRFQFPG